MAREYQEHDGVIDVNSLFVQYNYEDGAPAGVPKYVRLDEVVYPDGFRTVDYDYGTAGAIDDMMSRLATIGDGTDTHAAPPNRLAKRKSSGSARCTLVPAAIIRHGCGA